jgi:aspartyl-tRNA(Asn)/glutamyl-tRNA(Gln) amidotransferase subunit C
LIIDESKVRKIAALANLEFNEQEVEGFARQFSQIVEFVRQLSEVDTSGIEVDDIHGRPDSALFEDRSQPWLGPDQALANAPERDGVFFLVPKVITDE